jgi:hypothetical protein
MLSMKCIRLEVNNGFMLTLEKLTRNITYGICTILEAFRSSVGQKLSPFA